MSDMIDRLSDVATEAGEQATLVLSSGAVTVGLAARIRGGVRRRRLVTASLSAAVVLLGAAAGVVMPRLLAPPPIEPGADVRAPVQTNEGLLTYDDGSMQVLTRDGHVVEVPPPAIGSPVFAVQTGEVACAVDVTDLRPGWTPELADAFQLVTFARPLQLDSSGYHVLVQGQQVAHDPSAAAPQFAFSLDVDPAIAPYVVMTMTSYVLAPDGAVAYYGSQLESQPAVEYSGDKAAGTYTASLTTRSLRGGSECPNTAGEADWTTASGVVKYMVVTAFLNDGHGHVAPIATHASWITITEEGQ